MPIPTIDIRACAVDTGSDPTPGSDEVNRVAKQLAEALQDTGFVYLRNHGISDQAVAELNAITEKFFKLPVATKKIYSSLTTNAYHGWTAVEGEALNSDRPGDYKEAFNFIPCLANSTATVEEHVPGFKAANMKHYEECCILGGRVLMLIAMGLGLKDINLFKNSATPYGENARMTVRTLLYPAVPKEGLKTGQVRCGEHSDYGAISFVFQDGAGGLQIRNRQMAFVDVPPQEGCIVMNVGDMMQRWTADKLVSSKHRVLVPPEAAGRTRRSIVFFFQPDTDALIECVDGSNKYPPILAGTWCDQEVAAQIYKPK